MHCFLSIFTIKLPSHLSPTIPAGAPFICTPNMYDALDDLLNPNYEYYICILRGFNACTGQHKKYTSIRDAVINLNCVLQVKLCLTSVCYI